MRPPDAWVAAALVEALVHVSAREAGGVDRQPVDARALERALEVGAEELAAWPIRWQEICQVASLGVHHGAAVAHDRPWRAPLPVALVDVLAVRQGTVDERVAIAAAAVEGARRVDAVVLAAAVVRQALVNVV